MTKAVSNREGCFIKSVLLLCEHGHKIENGVFYAPPPSSNTIKVKVSFAVAKMWQNVMKLHTLKETLQLTITSKIHVSFFFNFDITLLTNTNKNIKL